MAHALLRAAFALMRTQGFSEKVTPKESPSLDFRPSHTPHISPPAAEDISETSDPSSIFHKDKTPTRDPK